MVSSHRPGISCSWILAQPGLCPVGPAEAVSTCRDHQHTPLTQTHTHWTTFGPNKSITGTSSTCSLGRPRQTFPEGLWSEMSILWTGLRALGDSCHRFRFRAPEGSRKSWRRPVYVMNCGFGWTFAPTQEYSRKGEQGRSPMETSRAQSHTPTTRQLPVQLRQITSPGTSPNTQRLAMPEGFNSLLQAGALNYLERTPPYSCHVSVMLATHPPC